MKNVNVTVDEDELNRIANRMDNAVKNFDPYAYRDSRDDGGNAYDYLLSDPYGAIDYLLDMLDGLMD